jgi:hypothetical protein
MAALLSGCAESRRGPWEGASPRQPLTLEVRNNHWLDVVVHAVTDGRGCRLGMVTGKRDAVLEIPAAAVVGPNGFRLEVDPVGSRETYISEVIYANPGSVVVLDVGSVLSMSSWHLRSGRSGGENR